MLGKIELVKFKESQEVAPEIKDALRGLCGASFKVIMEVGTQEARGINHVLLAEEILSDENFDRRLVLCVVNEFEGQYVAVPSEFRVIIA